MNEKQPNHYDHMPRVNTKRLLSRLAYYSGIRPSPLEPNRTMEQSYSEFRYDLETSYPQLAERGLALAALIPWAQQNGELQHTDMTPEMFVDGGYFYNLFTIGFGLIKDTYAATGQSMPPDVRQELWFDTDTGTPLTVTQFFDCLNVAQIEITEKYPALQLALQSFVKDRRFRHTHQSPRTSAMASIAASELYDGFLQMEAARTA